jgi:quinol monooxygenase YgiN
MLTERAELLIKEGEEENFDKAMRAEGLPLILSLDGALSARLGRGVENPDKFILLVEWRDMAAHDAYKGTPGQAALGKIMSPYTRGGAMEHFEIA